MKVCRFGFPSSERQVHVVSGQELDQLTNNKACLRRQQEGRDGRSKKGEGSEFGCFHSRKHPASLKLQVVK